MSYGLEAGIPEGAKLAVSELTGEDSGSGLYGEYLAKAEDALDGDEEISYARFFDISILDKDGEKVEIAAPVEVEIELEGAGSPAIAPASREAAGGSGKAQTAQSAAEDAGNVGNNGDGKNGTAGEGGAGSSGKEDGAAEDAGNAYVLHFAEGHGTGEVPEILEDAEISGDSASFEAAGFSVYAIIRTDVPLRTITGVAADGAVVEITGRLPEGAEAVIEPVELPAEELAARFGESMVNGMDSMALYDISILYGGAEYEPDWAVTVVIKNPAIETAGSGGEIGVSHLPDGQKPENIEATRTEDGDLSFRADSFSLYLFYTYTVDYYYGGNEYHMPGGTSMPLSALFSELAIDIPVEMVADLRFSNEALLETRQDGAGWTLVSLLPFGTDEELLVTLSDGSEIRILTKDALAEGAFEDYDKGMLEYIGPSSFSNGYYTIEINPQPGHYDIFGGGNGLPLSNVERTGGVHYSGDSGPYWYNGSISAGASFGVGSDGIALSKSSESLEPGWCRTGSRGLISWKGELKQAFFSLGYRYSGQRQIRITLCNPKRRCTKIEFTSEREDDWHYITFDATKFIDAGEQGYYSVIVEFKGTGIVQDMGWSIYGVSEHADFKEASIAGIIMNQRVDSKTYAEAKFMPITPRGEGKIWVNVHGGEENDGKKLGTSSLDKDCLDLKTSTGQYLTVGMGGNLEIEGIRWDDVSCPNDKQTAPRNDEKYSNRFAFGLYEFDTLTANEIIGVRKRMLDNNAGYDTFGSMMLMAETIDPLRSDTRAIKTLSIDGNGTNFSKLDSIGASAKFEFEVKALDGAPEPSRKVISNYFPVNAVDGQEMQLTIGEFTFEAVGTYKYEITEKAGNAANWSYDGGKLLLRADVEQVEVTAEGGSTKPAYKATYTMASEKATFTNTYTLPLCLKVVKKNTDNGELRGARFMLYSDAECTNPAEVYLDAERTEAKKLTASTPEPSTDNNGLLYFYGLKKGTEYYLKETAPPTGYIRDDTVVKVYYDNGLSRWAYQELPDGDGTPKTKRLTVSTSGNLGTLSFDWTNKHERFAITAKKVDSGNESKGLPGAQFEITRSMDNGKTYAEYRGDAANAPDGIYTSGEGGIFKMSLPEGYYKLTEKTAPPGYIISNSAILFQVIDRAGNKIVLTANAAGSARIEQTADKFTFTITNASGQVLPSTGGRGTWPYRLGGLLLLMAAAAACDYRRRQRNRA